MDKFFVGIDLGTTNTVLSYINMNDENDIRLLKVDGSELIPSIVATDAKGQLLFGKSAKKRIESSKGFVAYYKLGMLHPEQTFPLGDQHYTAEELSALFLGFIREHLFSKTDIKSDQQIQKLIISKPAAFTQTANTSTFLAAQKAGFKITKDDLISEPVAACYHYPFSDDDRLICVYDLGGGTFDSTILDNDIKAVKSTEGSGKLRELGGRNFDHCILKIAEQKLGFSIDPNDVITYNQILYRCLEAKEALSEESEVSLEFEYNREEHSCEISKVEFEQEAKPLVLETLKVCEDALVKAEISFSELDKILLIGGSTYMPIVRTVLEQHFTNCEIVTPEKDADTIVAIGAAKCAMARGNEEVTIVVPSQHSFGLISLNASGDKFINTIMIANGEMLPASYQETFVAQSEESKFYLTEFTGNQKMQRGDQSIDPKDMALSMMEIYTVSNIQPPYVLEVKYELSEGDVPDISVSQENNSTLAWQSERKVDKDFLDEPIEVSSIEEQYDIMITSSGFDNIGKVLDKMKIEYIPYNPDLNCDLLFINCGTGDNIESTKLRSFVEKGGSVYISDLASSVIIDAFPDDFDFEGNIGNTQTMNTIVVDEELKRIIGDYMEITFDMGGWSVLNSISSKGKVILKSAIDDKPIMVMMPINKGRIFYTCFHNNAQVSEKEEKLLKLLVLKQIGEKSNKTLDQMLKIYKV